MRSNRDPLDDMDIDREWIHTEVLGNNRKKSNLASNLVIILVIICTVTLLYIAGKDMLGKDDLSNLENMEQLQKGKQDEEAQKKAEEEAKAKAEADAEAAKKKAEEEVMTYTVKSGDSLAGIAAEFKVDQKSIVDANGIKDVNALEVGQVLKIPGVKKPTTDTTTPDSGSSATTSSGTAALPGEQSYTIKSGDTLAAIGIQFGVPYTEIMKLNNITDAAKIEIGQVLRIPPKPAATQ